MAKTETPESEKVSESYISVGLGLLVVVVVGILLYNYFTQRGAKPTTETPREESVPEATMSAKPGTTYTVVEGDTLWSISEKSYGTGYNWVDIQQANKLQSGDDLVTGQQLLIPEVSPKLAVVQISPAPVSSPIATPTPPSPIPSPTLVTAMVPSPAPVTTITGTMYTVVKGDTLWNIACRAYGDCYGWTKIAEANKLVNPNLIHPGNIFTLPR